MDAVIPSAGDWLPTLFRLVDRQVIECGVVPAGADPDHAVGVGLVLEVCDGFSVDGGADSAALEIQLHAVPAGGIQRRLPGCELLVRLLVGGGEAAPIDRPAWTRRTYPLG